jgi:hypothetical protein
MVATLEKPQTSSISNKTLTNFIVGRKMKTLKDLKGKIVFIDDYDYKSMRS